METLLVAWGPYGFGVGVVLLLWYAIVKPQLAINSAQAETLRETASTLLEVSETNKETARELRAVTLELKEWRDEIWSHHRMERTTNFDYKMRSSNTDADDSKHSTEATGSH